METKETQSVMLQNVTVETVKPCQQGCDVVKVGTR